MSSCSSSNSNCVSQSTRPTDDEEKKNGINGNNKTGSINNNNNNGLYGKDDNTSRYGGSTRWTDEQVFFLGQRSYSQQSYQQQTVHQSNQIGSPFSQSLSNRFDNFQSFKSSLNEFSV